MMNENGCEPSSQGMRSNKPVHAHSHVHVPRPRPEDGNLFIYMQILNLSDIQTVTQTFHSKFYLRATWVQKKSDALLQGMAPISINANSNSNSNLNDKECCWPMDVYKPDLGFDNAVEELEFKSQSLGVSTWRCPDMVPKQGTGPGPGTGTGTGKVQDDEDDNEDEYVVVEWKARGSGLFSQTFELENYPRDTQLLKIVISSLDQGIELHDDHRDKVQSSIREDYFLDQDFTMTNYEEILSMDDVTTTSAPIARGRAMASKEDVFVINPVNQRSFNTLSYIVPVERIACHVKREMLYPVSLITLSALVSFAFYPSETDKRLLISTIIALAMTGYSQITTKHLPRMKDPNEFSKYIFNSLLFVYGVVLESVVVSDRMRLAFGLHSKRVDLLDTVGMIMMMSLWLIMNMRIEFSVNFGMKINEKKRIIEELTIARDGVELKNHSGDCVTDKDGNPLMKVRKFDTVNPLYRNKFVPK